MMEGCQSERVSEGKRNEPVTEVDNQPAHDVRRRHRRNKEYIRESRRVVLAHKLFVRDHERLVITGASPTNERISWLNR